MSGKNALSEHQKGVKGLKWMELYAVMTRHVVGAIGCYSEEINAH